MYIQYVNIYCFYMTGPGLKREQVKFYFVFQIGLRLLINFSMVESLHTAHTYMSYKNIKKKILKRGVFTQLLWTLRFFPTAYTEC